MLNFKEEKVNIDDKLKQRIDFICKFCAISGNVLIPLLEKYKVNATLFLVTG